jgi:DNA-binding MarR family transcriptional regulator/N-acetylglutamate synthase-like GNAT family acetyltransferase
MSAAATSEHVRSVRAFSRFYTNVIGVLDEGLLRTPYALADARVIFELGQGLTEMSELRDTLSIDAGYLSRIVARLEHDGIVTRAQSTADARRQVLRLTAKGRRAFKMLDRRSSQEIARLLSSLGEDEQRRLVGAMTAIRKILGDARSDAPLVLRPARSGDFGWVIERHGAVYAKEHRWNEAFEALVARIVADYIEVHDPRRETVWIAELDGERVGCALCVRKEDDVAQLRLLLVEPRARGMGIGTRLVEECIRFARTAGYARMMLWTNDVLTDARRIYERAGFELGEEEPHRSFGRKLVGQNWWLEL